MTKSIEISISISRPIHGGPVNDLLSSARTTIKADEFAIMCESDFIQLVAERLASVAFKNCADGRNQYCSHCGVKL